VKIRQLDQELWEVTVDGPPTTTHRVTVPSAIAEKLVGPNPDIARLLEASFEFLLAREPNTSILRQFELSVIGHYFPEYSATMQARLRK